MTSTLISRGRRGTWWHLPSFHVARVAQTHIYRRFAWQAWHLWYWVAPLRRDLSPVTPGAPRHFAWQAWHLVTSTLISRGRRGTNSHLPSFCVAGVALMVLGGALGPGFVACDARGAAPLCVAGVALGDIHLDITWQAWHKLTSTVVLRGRRGTYGTGWRPWAGICRLWRPGRRATLRGRRGTWWHPPWYHVAGVAQTHIYRRQPHIHLRFAWQAWHHLTSTFVLRGRRGTHGTGWRAWAGLVADDAAALCVAGVAQPHIHLRFAWQAWRNLTSTFVLRGRRGTHGTGWRTWSGLVADDAAALCVAGVAQPHIHLRFAWQAWHHLTSTFVLHGRRSTWWHPPSFCVAGMALGDIHLCFVTYHLCHTRLCHTPSFTHHLWHTILDTPSFTPLCHTPSFTHRHKPSLTHHLSPHHLSHTNFVTHHLSHNFVTHQLCHTPSFTHQLCHTPSFTTPSFTQICHTPSFTQLCQAPTLSHTIFHTPTLSHTIFHHTIFHTNLSRTNFVTYHLSHTVTGHLSHTILHTPSFTHNFVTRNFHTHHLSHNFVTHTHTRHHLSLSHTSFHIQLCHTQFCFTSRSSTTSFVFPSFPIPATTFGAYYWRKLSCGVIRSFNLYVYQRVPSLEQ